MAQIANTVSTTTAKGNREKIVDAIWNIDPFDNPGLKLFDKPETNAILHEWLTGSLAAAGENAQIDGDDVDFSDAARPADVRLGNRLQIARKVVSVTGQQEFVRKAGRKSELAKELFKMGLEMRNDMEWAIFKNGAKVTGNSSTAAKMGGMRSWVATNDNFGAGGASPTGDGSDTRTDGTQRAFTEELLNDVMRKCWDNGGKPDFLICGSFNRGVFSTFQGVATNYNDMVKGTIIAAVDYYQSEYGTIKAIANRFSFDRDAWVLQSDLWAVPIGRKMFIDNLGKTGDAEKRIMLTDFTLEARNEKGSGLVADLTTS